MIVPRAPQSKHSARQKNYGLPAGGSSGSKRPLPRTLSPMPAVARLDDAAVSQGGTPVLTAVELAITTGEFVYLIGRSGAGKSSLLKTLYGALPLAAGSGEVVGYDLSRLDYRSIPLLRRRLGIVFQDFNLLYDRDASANLAFVLEATGWTDAAAKRSRVEEVLTQVDLAEKATAMPHRLSGGERQRLVLARALLNEPALLLADEPTGNLDPETADDVLQLIARLSRDYGMATVFATHDYRILEQFPARILRVGAGRVRDEADLRLL